MAIKILIIGFPRSGKTTLSFKLKNYLESQGKSVDYINVDIVRWKFKVKCFWDFSVQGRIEQGRYLAKIASHSKKDFVICDMVGHLDSMRKEFGHDWLIWVDTLDETSDQYKLMPAMYLALITPYEKPSDLDFHITTQDADNHAITIGDHIINSTGGIIYAD